MKSLVFLALFFISLNFTSGIATKQTHATILLNKTNFYDKILDYWHDEIWLILFVEPECIPCDDIVSNWHEYAKLMYGKINVALMNSTDKNKEISNYYNITTYPTIMHIQTHKYKYRIYNGSSFKPIELNKFALKDFILINGKDFKRQENSKNKEVNLVEVKSEMMAQILDFLTRKISYEQYIFISILGLISIVISYFLSKYIIVHIHDTAHYQKIKPN